MPMFFFFLEVFKKNTNSPPKKKNKKKIPPEKMFPQNSGKKFKIYFKDLPPTRQRGQGRLKHLQVLFEATLHLGR